MSWKRDTFEWLPRAWSFVILPYVCSWDLRYRGVAHAGEIRLRPAPPPCEKDALQS